MEVDAHEIGKKIDGHMPLERLVMIIRWRMYLLVFLYRILRQRVKLKDRNESPGVKRKMEKVWKHQALDGFK